MGASHIRVGPHGATLERLFSHGSGYLVTGSMKLVSVKRVDRGRF